MGVSRRCSVVLHWTPFILVGSPERCGVCPERSILIDTSLLFSVLVRHGPTVRLGKHMIMSCVATPLSTS